MAEDRVLDQIMKMIESSNKRMEIIMKQPLEEKWVYKDNDIKLAQKEFEMQLKLLDMALKNMKHEKDPINVTPEDKKEIQEVLDGERNGGCWRGFGSQDHLEIVSRQNFGGASRKGI